MSKFLSVIALVFFSISNISNAVADRSESSRARIAQDERDVAALLVKKARKEAVTKKNGTNAYTNFSRDFREGMKSEYDIIVSEYDYDTIIPLYVRAAYGVEIIKFALELASLKTVSDLRVYGDPNFVRMIEMVGDRAEKLGFESEVLKGPVSFSNPKDPKKPIVKQEPVWIKIKPKGIVPVIALHAHLDTVKISDESVWVFPPYPARLIEMPEGLNLPTRGRDVAGFAKVMGVLPDQLRRASKDSRFQEIDPSSTKWIESFNPFDSARARNLKLVGRGIVDDKGPFAALMYVLKAVEDAKLDSNAVLYAGLGEENAERWEAALIALIESSPPKRNIVVDAWEIVGAEGWVTPLYIDFLNGKFPTPKNKTFVIQSFNNLTKEEKKPSF